MTTLRQSGISNHLTLLTLSIAWVKKINNLTIETFLLDKISQRVPNELAKINHFILHLWEEIRFSAKCKFYYGSSMASCIKTPSNSCDIWNGNSSIGCYSYLQATCRALNSCKFMMTQPFAIWNLLSFRRENNPPDRLILRILFPIVNI